MATADELLSLMSTDGDDKTLVIDNYLRTITIPKSVTCLGVEYDDDVLQLDFKMPRYFGDIDLSKFSIRVNYLNAQGEGDVYTVKNPTVTSSSILFTWLVGPTATTYKGDTKFNVCLKLMTADGYIDKEYNTTIATLPVLEGLETDERAITMYTDILEQWRRELFGVGDTEEAAMRAVSAEEQKNIAQKGLEVLATIPEDYTKTSEAAKEGIRTKADAIVCTAQGERITVSDSSDDYLRGLRVFGKTTQVSTTGKNLVDLSDLEFSDSNYVHTFGPSNSSANDFYEFLKANTGKNIVLSMTTTGTASGVDIGSIRYYNEGDVLICAIIPGVMHTIIELPDVFHACYVYGSTNGASIKNLQVEFGETATEYEPYSGRVASPSPDWPQEPTNIVNPGVSMIGKNLLDMAASAYYDSGVIKTAYSGYNSIASGFQKIRVYPGRTYTFSYKVVFGGDRLILNLYDIDNTLLGDVDIGWGTYLAAYNGRYGAVGDGATFTIPTESKITFAEVHLCQMNDCGEGNCNIYAELQFEENASATEYEPYRTPQTIAVNYSTSGIPVTEGGNYTDDNGQQWICDEIDFERGTYVRRINKVVLTGEEQFGVLADSGGEMFISLPSNAMHTNYLITCKCNYYPTVARQDTYNNGTVAGYVGAAVSSTHARITDNVRFNGDYEALNNWVIEKYAEGNPLVFEYILETPIETPLTEEELEVFKALKTNYPHTTVLNDSGAHMELSYNADTKTYVDNGIKQSVTDVLEAIENGSFPVNINFGTDSTGKLVYIAEDGMLTPLEVGDNLSIEDGVIRAKESSQDDSSNCLLTIETITIEEPSEPGSVPVTGIVLDYSTISLDLGDSMMLAASVLPSNAINTAIIWETSDNGIATVENGLVTAVASGNCTITAKSAENSSIKATCSVAVAAESGGDEPGEDTDGKIMFESIEPVKTDANIKRDGVTEDLSTDGYAYYKLPYSEGMTISTCTRVSWVGTVPPVVVIDNGVVSVPTFTDNGYISSLLNNYTVTLTGFTDSAIVYANVADGDDNTMTLCYYIPGNKDNTSEVIDNEM